MKPRLFLLLIFLLTGLYSSQTFDFQVLEKTIDRNNQLGRHKISQQKLLDVLKNEDLDLNDQVKANLLLAKTFRSINDYATAINYLKKTQTLSLHLTGKDSLIMDIRAELALAYFDNHNYTESGKIMAGIAREKYRNLDEGTKAYLIMQQAYINFLNKDYQTAEKQYVASLAILKKYSPCNMPPVMVKQLQLYGRKKDFNTMERIYMETVKIADSCSILKYKIYATDEIENIYQENKMVEKAFHAGKLLDSLKTIDARETNLLDMHLKNENFLQQQNQNDKDHSFRNTILLVGLLLLMIALGIYFYRKSKSYKKENLKFEAEIREMKKVLQAYSQQEFSQDKKDNSILKTELLNERQKQLLEQMSEGLSNKAIAEKLFISENTVKYHIKNIYLLLDLKDRKDLLTKIKKTKDHQ